MIPIDSALFQILNGAHGFIVLLESRPDLKGPVKYDLITKDGKPFEIRQQAEEVANKASCRLDAIDAWVIETKNITGYSSIPA